MAHIGTDTRKKTNMSRSNPTENMPNPSQRWFEWNGAEGHFRYYDKEAKQNVDMPSDFTFIVLDRLASVRGWHEQSESGIVSNEVRDTRSEPLVVRSFKGGPIATGIYQSIRDRVANAGGRFTITAYCAFREDGKIKMGGIQLRGAALRAWSDFEKKNRKAIF